MTDTWPEQSINQSPKKTSKKSGAGAIAPSTPTRSSRSQGFSHRVQYDHFVRTTESSSQTTRFSLGDTVIIGRDAVMKQAFLHTPFHQLKSAVKARTRRSPKKKSREAQSEAGEEDELWFSQDGLGAHDKVAVIVGLYADESDRMMAQVRWFARPSAVWGRAGPPEEERIDDYELYYTSDSTYLQELSMKQAWQPNQSPSTFISSSIADKSAFCSDPVPVSTIVKHVLILSPSDPKPQPVTGHATPSFVVKKVYDAKPIDGADWTGEIDWEEVYSRGIKYGDWDVEPTMLEAVEEEEPVEVKKRKGKSKAEGRGKKRRKTEHELDGSEPEYNASSDDDGSAGDDFEAESGDEEEEGDDDSDKENVEEEDEDEHPSKRSTQRSPSKKIRPKITQAAKARASKIATKKKRFSERKNAAAMLNPLPPAFTTAPGFLKLPPFERAKAMLHVSATPENLPCREVQRNAISNLLGEAIIDQRGTCLYVHGVPGTGKTATVHSIIRELQQDEDMDKFQFVEINGMKIAEPTTAFSALWEAISGQKSPPRQALLSLENHFQTPDPARKTTVVLVDELDQMITKKQDVIYNFFNWPHVPHSRLIVVAVANTMDLPEREMSGKIRSRLGSNRIVFKPYKWEELQTILLARLEGLDSVFAPKAIEIIAKRVAAGPGDARRALDIARRTVEKVDQRNRDNKDGEPARCGISDATATYTEMTNHGSSIFIKKASLHQKILLLSVAQCIKKAGVPEVEFEKVIKWHLDFLRQTGITPVPTHTELFSLVADLHSLRLVATESQRQDHFQRVRSLVSNNDLFELLKDDEKLKKFVPKTA